MVSQGAALLIRLEIIKQENIYPPAQVNLMRIMVRGAMMFLTNNERIILVSNSLH